MTTEHAIIDTSPLYEELSRLAKENADLKKQLSWTPCSEGTPASDGVYDVTVVTLDKDPIRVSDIAWHSLGQWWRVTEDSCVGSAHECQVLAWRPRPEPYRGDP